ncbi:hypothetical protein Y1Q_0001945 [Alligator mississippiensis]|uniref:Uncharacterized protein n=1 Tax=Alligator mississippiensis TaxID=8496 RepID=A0A151PGB6_ALLMI|nr:hypothetical protein Y1Q_0001945 [Alligator mississippiensis]
MSGMIPCEEQIKEDEGCRRLGTWDREWHLSCHCQLFKRQPQMVPLGEVDAPDQPIRPGIPANNYALD